MNRLRLAAIVLLLIGAALFAIGTSIEKTRHHEEPAASEVTGETHDEAGESVEQRAAEGHSATNESGEGRILGIDREATGLVVLAALASLAIAALLWQRPSLAVWAVAGVVALAFAIFDVAEVAHQLDESQNGLALLAALVAIAHAGTTALALASVRAARVP